MKPLQNSITILAGASARQKLRDYGWDPSLFTTMVGASGGPRLLGIAGLDRFLFGDFLQRSNQPMHLIGSSIGSWRHAALASPDPIVQLDRLHDYYVRQSWDENDKRPTSQVIDELCEWVMDNSFDDKAYNSICTHPRFTTHIVTARGLGPNGSERNLTLGPGMALAAIGNAINRQLLQQFFQRVVFSSAKPDGLAFQFEDFSSVHVSLRPENVRVALLASGSIPFAMSGKRIDEGAPIGLYWDGGIIDYHFDLTNIRYPVLDKDDAESDDKQAGLVLYPHFSDRVIPGWFDKFLPWRGTSAELFDRLVLVSPSRQYLSTLPQGKIPNRSDFKQFSQSERVRYWQMVVTQSQQLGDAFSTLVDASDPLAGVLDPGIINNHNN